MHASRRGVSPEGVGPRKKELNRQGAKDAKAMKRRVG